ncbi:MAG: efflux RND transporter periplasmic adaptor subunit [Burkholderiaceae bacterium]|nr:efflux RND transporter periplasmic adaptor subunit [Burkholderiaceae bacterium]
MKRRNEFDQHITTLASLQRRRYTIAIGAVLICAAAAGVALKSRPAKAADSQPAGPAMVRQGDKITVPANSPLRARLAVQAVGAAGGAHALLLPGVVEADPARTVNILPPLTGRLAELKVALGDVVAQGQLLAVMHSPDLDQAWSDVEKARDALDLARKALERAKGVHEAGANAVKDYEQANSNYEQALAEDKRAQTRLNTLNGGKSKLLDITAPVSGTVVALNNGVGSYINDPTAAIMTIANLDHVWVTANVPEDQVAVIAKGQKADVELAAYPGQVFHGTVSFVSAVLEPDTHRNKTRIAFSNTDGKMKPNMYANVSFAIAQGGELAVPSSALLMNNDSTTVFVETAPWTFERRTVELGQEDGPEGRTTVRILSGLKTGERVIVRGGVLLND